MPLVSPLMPVPHITESVRLRKLFYSHNLMFMCCLMPVAELNLIVMIVDAACYAVR